MSQDETSSRPEIVVGLVSPLGVALESVDKRLRQSLRSVGYKTHPIRLSALLHGLAGQSFAELAAVTARDEWIERHIEAANRFCQRVKRHDAMARLALGEIRTARERISGAPTATATGQAYVLRSLKRAEEVETLRRIYGDRFIAIACHAPQDQREKLLAEEIARSRRLRDAKAAEGKASELINVDAAQVDVEYGQHVRSVFPLADVFVDTSNAAVLQRSLDRFINLLFSNNLITPRATELGMFHAQAAAYRSASLGRQVGAAILDDLGELICVGTNEVPRPLGGQYWEADNHVPDGRDHTLERDPSAEMLETVLADVLRRLNPWFTKTHREADIDMLLHRAKNPMAGSDLLDVIEYMRAVHAEMAALTTAARRGAAVRGATMVCTTMPCHECAKHIVASGIRSVEYIAPYEKNLVGKLYSDSILLDAPPGTEGAKVAFRQFVGVAPRRFSSLFEIDERLRKDELGKVIDWNDLSPKLPRVDRSRSSQLASLIQEQTHWSEMFDQLESKRFTRGNRA